MIQTTVHFDPAAGLDCETVSGVVTPGVTVNHRTWLTPATRFNRAFIDADTEGLPYESALIEGVRSSGPAFVHGVDFLFNQLEDHGLRDSKTLKKLPRLELFGTVISGFFRVPRPALYADVVVATTAEARAFKKGDLGTRDFQVNRNYQPTNWNDDVARWLETLEDHLSPLTNWDEKFAFWSFDRACELAGLDSLSKRLLIGILVIPARNAKREWLARGTEMGLNENQIEASKKAIASHAEKISEILAQKTNTEKRVHSYDLPALRECIARWDTRPRKGLKVPKQRKSPTSPIAISSPGKTIMRNGIACIEDKVEHRLGQTVVSDRYAVWRIPEDHPENQHTKLKPFNGFPQRALPQL